MKKLFALLLVLGLCGGIAACGGTAPDTGPSLRDNVTLDDVVEQLSVQYELTMPGMVDEDFLREIFGVSPKDVESFSGQMSMSMTSADSLLAVKVQPGQAEAVQKALEARLEFVRKSFQGYDEEAYQKAQAGQVYAKGDYLFLMILGRPGESAADEAVLVKEAVDDYFRE